MFKSIEKKAISYGVIFNSIRMLIGASSTLFIMSKGLDLAGIAELKAFQALVILFSDIPFGYIADRYSRKFSVNLSVLCGAIWMILTALSPSISWLYVAEFFNAISIAFFGGAFQSILISISKKENEKETSSSRILGEYSSIQFIAMAVFALVGGMFSEYGEQLWLVSGILLFAQFIILNSFIPNLDQDSSKKNPIVNQFFNDINVIKETYNMNMVFIIISSLLTFLLFQVFIQYWQPIMNESSFIANRLFLYGPLFSVILVAQSIAGKLIKKVEDPRSIYFASSGFILISLISLIMSFGTIFSAVSLVGLFFSLRLNMILANSIFNDAISDDLRATLASFNSTLGRIGIILILPGIGLLLELYGLRSLSYIAIPMVLICGLLAFKISKTKHS